MKIGVSREQRPVTQAELKRARRGVVIIENKFNRFTTVVVKRGSKNIEGRATGYIQKFTSDNKVEVYFPENSGRGDKRLTLEPANLIRKRSVRNQYL